MFHLNQCRVAFNGLMMDVTEQCSAWCLDQLRLALKQQTAPSDTAAVLIEPLMVRILDHSILRDPQVIVLLFCDRLYSLAVLSTG